MRRFAVLMLSLLLALVLVSCGGEPDDAGSDVTASDDSATDDSATDDGASDDGGSEENPGGSGLPTVEGEFGEKPTLAVPEGEPPAELTSEVLIEGDGPEVESGQLLVAHYLGQTWAEKEGEVNVFDNSYDRGAPAVFPIGTGGVIEGWDETLVGVNAGSRVLMTVPPEQGYGESGQPGANIAGDDTLIFVVDVLASYPPDVAIDGEPTGATPPNGVTVEGAPGERPTITIPAGTPPPTEPSATVLVEGSGPAIELGANALLQVQPVSWSGQQLQSTWDTTPQVIPVGREGQESPLDLLQGVNVGSRVLLLIPAQEGDDPATQSIAVVIDVLGLPGAEEES